MDVAKEDEESGEGKHAKAIEMRRALIEGGFHEAAGHIKIPPKEGPTKVAANAREIRPGCATRSGALKQ
eukprot:4261412-Alexandrium_andersonii.AAC.1